MLHVAQLGGKWNLPIGGYASVSVEFLSKRTERFPTLSRLYISVTQHGEAFRRKVSMMTVLFSRGDLHPVQALRLSQNGIYR